MYLKQYYLGCLAHASYLIADERTKISAVVDPQRDIGQYLTDASEHGWEIRHVFLTHFHADFLAGHIELREKTGAHIYLGAAARAEYEFTPLRDDDVLEFGDVRLRILETPGHTPESISILVYDLRVSDSHPYAVLTGDTLFIGDVGRPDLLASIGVTADELAEMLYHSMEKLKSLPDDTLVYPAHGAGSLCGKNLSNETVSTIGEQKRFNYALQPMSQDDFIRIVEADQPEAPEYFVYDAIRNRQERPTLDEALSTQLRPLSVDEVLSLRQQQEAQVLDVRDAADFEGAHLRGSLNIGLRGKYAQWCGSLLGHDEPIVVIADVGEEREAVMRLGRIGFENTVGYLEGGMHALASRADLLEVTPRITARALADGLSSGEKLHVLDVRSPQERDAKGFIQGSVNIPLTHLVERVGALPRSGQLVVHCAGGYRSAIACSLLERHGVACTDMVGGFDAWLASHLPVAERSEAV